MDLLKKLRLNTDLPLWLVNAPDNCRYLFDGLEIKTRPGKEAPVAQLMLFVMDSTDLHTRLVKLNGYIGPETVFWICYPKQTGAIKSDLIKMEPWAFVTEQGYRGQTSVAVNDDWTGMRFTNAPAKKPSQYNIAPELRNIEGIDFVNRTVTLPADALNAMNNYPGMAEQFYKWSFTNKKEAVIAIVDARKEETRKRRIDKLITALSAPKR